MQEIADLIACEHCDALYRRPRLALNEAARCERCDAVLLQGTGHRHLQLLPLTIACLVMFVIANVFPIVTMELQGIPSQTTLLGAVLKLNAEGRPIVASVVLSTTILFPLFQLLIMLYLFVPLPHAGRPRLARLLLRALQMLRPWGMVEVFVLGCIVALVKLSGMATVIPGAALWALGSLALLLAALFSYDPRLIWQLPHMKAMK